MRTIHGPSLTVNLRRALILGATGAAFAGHASGAGDGWKLTPSIGLEQVYNSNQNGPQSNNEPDVVSQFTPGLHITGDTPHATVDFNYSPTFNHFEMGTSQDRVDQSQSAQIVITPVANHLMIDLDTYAVQMGGRANSTSGLNGTLTTTDDRLLYYVGTLAPHFTERFGDVASVDAYYRLKSTNTSDESSRTAGGPSRSEDSLQNEAEAIIGSGESFGRLSAQLNFSHNSGLGSGENTQTTNDSDYLSLEYHINRTYSLTGSLGYQRIHYDATLEAAPYTNEGMTWNAGARFTPNPSDSVEISYGLQQGAYVPTLKMTYALGPRTLVTASYVTKVQTQLQAISDSLQFLTFDPSGRPIDSRTGLPFVGVNSIFGSQNALFRDKPLLLSVNHQFVRSAITATFTYETRSAVTGLPAKDTAIGGAISYTRELTPVLNCNVDFEFTDHKSTGAVGFGAEHAKVINTSVLLEYRLSDTATAKLAGTYLRRSSSIPANNSTTTQVSVGVKKEF